MKSRMREARKGLLGRPLGKRWDSAFEPFAQSRGLWPLALCLAAFSVSAIEHDVNDTGLVICYDASAISGTVDAATPDPEAASFNRQDCTSGTAAADAVAALATRGASATPGRDYTKISNAGGELPASAELGFDADTWNCTRDNVTGLVWEVKWRLDSGLHDSRHLYTWFDTNGTVNGGNMGSAGTSTTCTGLLSCNTSAYRDLVNGLVGSERLCGQTDWRLPTASELESLLDLGVVSGPTIDLQWFPGSSTTAANYWSGDNVPTSGTGENGWAVSFSNGLLSNFAKTNAFRVRLVRDAP